jgi:hypothetical protein
VPCLLYASNETDAVLALCRLTLGKTEDFSLFRISEFQYDSLEIEGLGIETWLVFVIDVGNCDCRGGKFSLLLDAEG